MRHDIEKLIQHILLHETEVNYGVPTNNKSIVIIVCIECGGKSNTTITALKQRLSKNKKILCNQCIGRLSWTKERREKNASYWTENQRQNHSGKMKAVLNDQETKIKHRRACKESYKKNPNRVKILSDISKERWENSDYRQEVSQAIKAKWKDSDFRQKQENFRTAEYKARASFIQSEVSKRYGYAHNMSNRIRALWNLPEYRLNQT